jgi:UDP-N-acetylmuramate dehydrogenase
MRFDVASLGEEYRSLGLDARVHEPLSLRTSIGVGGGADLWVAVRSLNDLRAAVAAAGRAGAPWRVLGWGSNVLVDDQGVTGVVVDTREMRGVESEGGKLHVTAGEPLAGLVRTCLTLGLSGPEVLNGIPGTVGGALAGNAGGRYGTVDALVERLVIVRPDGTVEECVKADVEFGVRSCRFGEGAVGRGIFRLPEGDRAKLEQRAHEILEEKKARQPLGARSAGCFFQNPPGRHSAGELIDQAGLKGRRVGGAEVSLVHANYIVNRGGATFQDVMALAAIVQEAVQEDCGVALEREVRVWRRENGDETQ